MRLGQSSRHQPAVLFPFMDFESGRPIARRMESTCLSPPRGLSSTDMVASWLWTLLSERPWRLFLSSHLHRARWKKTYLNHYYFVGLILLHAHVPAGQRDVLGRRPEKQGNRGPAHTRLVYRGSVRVIVCMLYFYAGIAKLNSDWLLQALPMRIWLPAKNDTPLFGPLFDHLETAYIFSWIGCILRSRSVGFLLWNRRTRILAYASVVIFHLMTALLFPIGMFPYIMIVTALVFFPAEFHQKIIDRVGSWLGMRPRKLQDRRGATVSRSYFNRSYTSYSPCFLYSKSLFPFRYLLYPERALLDRGRLPVFMEGYADGKSWLHAVYRHGRHRKKRIINNNDFLTTLQEKMMSTQPDIDPAIWRTCCATDYATRGFRIPACICGLVRSPERAHRKPLVSSDVNLAQQTESSDINPGLPHLTMKLKAFRFLPLLLLITGISVAQTRLSGRILSRSDSSAVQGCTRIFE